MGHILWYADRVPGEEVRTMQDGTYPAQPDADGETLEALAEETWQLLCDNA